MPALAPALYLSAMLGQYDDDRAEVERLASDLIELSTRQDFAFFLPIGEMLRGGSSVSPAALRKASPGSMTECDAIREPVRWC
jgi:hypothetical protein